jgi:hypothetical protein
MTVQSHLGRDAYPSELTVRSDTAQGRRRFSSPTVRVLGAITFLAAAVAASAAPPAAGAAPAGLATADGEQTGTRAVITDLKRAGNTVTLKFVIYNDSGSEMDTSGQFTDNDYKGYLSFSGVHLLDQTGKKKYYAVKDSDGNCVCTDGINGIKAKTSVTVWVKYPAPPEGTQKITVQIPHFVPVEDVPIG